MKTLHIQEGELPALTKRNQVELISKLLRKYEADESISTRLVRICEAQKKGEWLLVRHLFDQIMIRQLPCKTAFDYLVSQIQALAKSKHLKIKEQTVGEWDFIMFEIGI